MFQNLRAGTPVYVLNKSERWFEVGEVTFVSNPLPQYQITGFHGQTPSVVDITVKCPGRTQPLEFKQVPANQSIYDYKGYNTVISDSREAISNEINIFRQNCQRVLDSAPYNEETIKLCDTWLQDVNPQIKQEAARQREMNALDKRVSGIEDSVERMEGMLAQVIQTLKVKSKKED